MASMVSCETVSETAFLLIKAFDLHFQGQKEMFPLWKKQYGKVFG